MLVGGIVSAATPDFLETASICVAVAAALAAWFIFQYFQVIRGLHSDPVHEVASLHKRRVIKSAGFVDAAQSSSNSRSAGERRDSDAPETDGYGVMGDIDILGQKSDDAVNRTDDPSRGPIE